MNRVPAFSIDLNDHHYIILISIISCQSLRGFEKKEKMTEPIRASCSYHSIKIMIWLGIRKNKSKLKYSALPGK